MTRDTNYCYVTLVHYTIEGRKMGKETRESGCEFYVTLPARTTRSENLKREAEDRSIAGRKVRFRQKSDVGEDS